MAASVLAWGLVSTAAEAQVAQPAQSATNPAPKMSSEDVDQPTNAPSRTSQPFYLPETKYTPPRPPEKHYTPLTFAYDFHGFVGGGVKGVGSEISLHLDPVDLIDIQLSYYVPDQAVIAGIGVFRHLGILVWGEGTKEQLRILFPNLNLSAGYLDNGGLVRAGTSLTGVRLSECDGGIAHLPVPAIIDLRILTVNMWQPLGIHGGTGLAQVSTPWSVGLSLEIGGLL